MWDLIVSVPDHCLSFYFIRRVVQILYPFSPEHVHCSNIRYVAGGL